jgi:arginase family enzyme
MNCGVHFDLDGAWANDVLNLPRVDLREWGPRLRYSARRADIDAFARHIESHAAPFILYGSGDFHHLAAIFLRRNPGPLTLISFDNHPDWDIRPPYWGCGNWINRALESPLVDRAVIWGCGNFELAYPAYLFANRRALRSGRLQIHAWAERQSAGVRRRFDCMTRENWRDRFERFAAGLAGQQVYITIDLDCLSGRQAFTNWENGLFETADLQWSLAQIRSTARIVGGDICGACSRPLYARWTQRLAAHWDHPRPRPSGGSEASAVNRAAIEAIWPALAGGMAL